MRGRLILDLLWGRVAHPFKAFLFNMFASNG
jgi:hypothetical protein